MISKQIRLGASAAIFKNDKLLLVQRGTGAFTGLWSLPGGHIHDGEAPKAAAIREVREETGIEAEITDHIDTIHIESDIDISYKISVFYGKWIAGELTPSDDARDARWVLPGEIDLYSTTEGLPEIIAKAQTCRHSGR